MSMRYCRAMSERMSRAQQQQVTRARLLDAAEALFGERGIHQTSLDEVARRAGLTKGAIYANFSGKKDLIAAILDRKRAGDAEDYETAIDRADTRRFVQAFVEFWLYGMRDEGAREMVAQWLSTVRDGNAREAAARFGDDLPVPPQEFAALMLALDIGVSLQRLVDPAAVPATLYATGLDALRPRT
jgi:AcrR family transcriptional regulator